MVLICASRFLIHYSSGTVLNWQRSISGYTQFVSKTTRTQLGTSIDRAYTNLVSAADRYKVLLEQVTAYDESFRAAEIRFNNGVGTSVDYLIAKNNLDRANIDLITTKYDYVLRTKILDFYQNKQLW
jgi:outer membrane protein